MNPANLIPQSDTATAPVRRFRRTRYANLVLDAVSGVYHARAKVGGRLVRRALGTKSIEAAKRRLDALLAEERTRTNLHAPMVDGWTMGRLADSWMEAVAANGDLKPRAVEYRRETLAMIRATWDGFDALKPTAVSAGQCKLWAEELRKRYSPSRFNGCVETLRGIFQRAMTLEMVAVNPALQVERKGAAPRKLNLPSVESFRKVVAKLGSKPRTRQAAWLVRFLAFSGARPDAARRVMPGDVDLVRNEISLPPIKHQQSRLTVPMSPDLRAVVVELLAEHPGGNQPLLPIRSPRRALATACRELGLPRLRPYDLRHLFTTHLLESGVAPALVAALRGDRDGGAMLLKTYFHARNEAMAKAMRKVKF